MMPRLLPIMGSSSVRGLIQQSISFKLDPHEMHWHLGPLGVLPDERGRGIGSQLAAATLNELDRDGVPAYGETDQIRVVRQYQRMGFQIIAEANILGVHNWLCWRNPYGK